MDKSEKSGAATFERFILRSWLGFCDTFSKKKYFLQHDDKNYLIALIYFSSIIEIFLYFNWSRAEHRICDLIHAEFKWRLRTKIEFNVGELLQRTIADITVAV